MKQTIYVGFTRDNDYVGTEILNEETHEAHYQELEEDFNFICDAIRNTFENDESLSTITGPNKLLQIRTKASKTKGKYTPLMFAGHQLKDKGMAFYLTGAFGKQLL